MVKILNWSKRRLVEPRRDELTVRQERAVLVGVGLPERPLEQYPGPLAELRGLAKTAGAVVMADVVQNRQKPDLSTYIGRGKLQELEQVVKATDANVVIFDNELLPSQVKNIEQVTNAKVIDRTELILDIFATRAQTKQARLQVELAQLEYFRPRLKRLWTHLERHGGGIGTRGPGEQQIETDRRLIDKKIRDLKARLSVIQERKSREVEARRSELRVCLVGYTNAGKSTLMNRLTGADVLVADKLFATLDTRTRQWHMPEVGKVLLSDTVGFIRNLPHDLVESFKATLEEATHADLLLHVVDASNPQAKQQIEAVNQVLEEIGARSIPTVLVLNQIDRVTDLGQLHALEKLHPRSVSVSAADGIGIDRLQALVAETLSEKYVVAEVKTHAGNGKLLAQLATHSQILERRFDGEDVRLTVRAPRAVLNRIDPEQATVLIGMPSPSGEGEDGTVHAISALDQRA